MIKRTRWFAFLLQIRDPAFDQANASVAVVMSMIWLTGKRAMLYDNFVSIVRITGNHYETLHVHI